MKRLIASTVEEEQSFELKGAGCLFSLLKKMFKLIDRSVIFAKRSRTIGS